MSGRVGLRRGKPGTLVGDIGEVTPLAACDIAGKLLRRAGFTLVWVSMKSEACYFTFPGRHGVLRVATHAKGARNPDFKDGPTLASVTFSERSADKGGIIRISAECLEYNVAAAIGIYLMRSGAEP